MTKRSEAEKAVVRAAMRWHKWITEYAKMTYVTQDDIDLAKACARLAKMRGKRK